MRNNAHGFTLIEVMVVLLITVVMGAGLVSIITGTYQSQYQIVGQNGANASTRQALDTIIDRVRGMTSMITATATEIKFAAPDTGQVSHTYRYWLAGSQVLKSVDGVPAGGTLVVSDVTAFAISYYVYAGGAWTGPFASPTAANVGAVKITVTTTENGVSRQITSTVQLREKRDQYG